jgi:hypothetical protein
MAKKNVQVREALSVLKQELKPEVYEAVAASVGLVSSADLASDDNQNQNQNGREELMQLKPSVLRTILTFSLPGAGGTAESNQNQNQNGGLASLAIEKPDVILELGSRITTC